MKLCVSFIAAIAVCAGSASSSALARAGAGGVGVPGDNRGYREGDRYVWLPDGRGVPRLADLRTSEEPAAAVGGVARASGTRYWLYTRQNPSTPQLLVYGDNLSIVQSNFNPTRTVNVIVHGWNGDGESDLNKLITAAFLDADDSNVIVMDWGHLANGLYLTATANTPGLGVELGEFLKYINLLGAPFLNMHLVGFSLGAHLVGTAGRQVGGQVGRITGLEPAGPGWGSSNSNTLRSSDGIYVEGIHTDSDLLGMWDFVGHVDMYPNGGSSQPGCWLSTCSHSRSWELFASTVTSNHLWGRQCTTLNQAMSGACTGVTYPMGNGIINKRGTGIYYVATTSSWPY